MDFIHVGTETIETERLILRKFNKNDNEMMLLNWIGDEEIQKNYGEPAYKDIAAVNQILQKWIDRYDNVDFYRWAIIEKNSGLNMGQVAFCEVDAKAHSADVEYCIGREFQRKGYASEALSAVIKYAFETGKFNRIQAFHRKKNHISGGVLRKCGMQYEGTLRQASFHDGEYDDRIYFSILRDEYIKAR